MLLAGSLAAAFAAGMVAFFAPCCAGVMMPAYLAAIGGRQRLRIARLTAVYVAGVALVVLPITLGAAAAATYFSRWHSQLFALGGLMMIGVAVALWRGTMLPVGIPQPRMTGSTLSVFGLGVFSGAATACCAPVLAGAIVLSATSGSLLGGLSLGLAYVAGMMAPLVPLALLYRSAQKRVKDPMLTLHFAGRQKRIGLAKLVGVIVFTGFGLLFIILALTGNSETAPGFQRSFGLIARQASVYVAAVPNVLSLPLLLAITGSFIYLAMKRGGENNERQES